MFGARRRQLRILVDATIIANNITYAKFISQVGTVIKNPFKHHAIYVHSACYMHFHYEMATF